MRPTYILSDGAPQMFVAAIVEDTVCLVVANQPVVARAAGVQITAVLTGKPSTIEFDNRTVLGRVSGGGTRGAPVATSVGSTTLAGATTYKRNVDVERIVDLAGAERTTPLKLDELRSNDALELDEAREDKIQVHISHS